MMEASRRKNIQCTRYDGIVCCIIAPVCKCSNFQPAVVFYAGNVGPSGVLCMLGLLLLFNSSDQILQLCVKSHKKLLTQRFFGRGSHRRQFPFGLHNSHVVGSHSVASVSTVNRVTTVQTM